MLLAALGLVACAAAALARRRGLPVSVKSRFAEGSGMAVVLLFAGAAALAIISDWPPGAHLPQALGSPGGFAVASALLILATPCLIAQRSLAAIPAEQLPETVDLGGLLFLPVGCLFATSLLALTDAPDVALVYWSRSAISAALLAVCLELVLRALGSWFLPSRDHTAARAPIASVVAGFLCGRLLSPARAAVVVRSEFGVDFTRSWALRFMRAAAAPVLLLMLLCCWGLTGVTRIDLNERGSYERFGRVVAILQPGLHLVLPRPFGAVRHVEYGTLHAVLISNADSDAGADSPVADASAAEGDPPPSANRLWDSQTPGEAPYLIAAGDRSQPSFQAVSVTVRVLYRVGLTDDAARAALYRTADPEVLVHSLSGRLLADYLATSTLPTVLGENHGIIAASLRAGLQQALDRLDSGLDIVAVTIEAIHPPSGAALAYRHVQAAEIAATSSIATERGRAETTRSVAERDAHSAIDEASALSQESISAAQTGLTEIIADDRPYRAASQPFLLERYFTDIKAALANVPLEILDHRLSGTGLPVVDLRPPGGARDGLQPRAASGEREP
ncbi:MAG: hypothetical protein JOZ42_15605 [Acetobacteraceae bacterium]|nr:hypothetical protein [Acetobacteraceae bacterium]